MYFVMKPSVIASVRIACLMAGNQLALADLLGVNPSFVSQWKNGSRSIPIKYCQGIVQVCEGLVSVQELRPDDWHEIWPLPEIYVPEHDITVTLTHVKEVLFSLLTKDSR